MDNLFFEKRVLFEWLRDRLKEQTHAEISSLKEITDGIVNSLILQRLVFVLSLRSLATSSLVLKKDYPWSVYLEKHSDPSNSCIHFFYRKDFFKVARIDFNHKPLFATVDEYSVERHNR